MSFVEVPKYFRPDINVTLDTINDYYVISCVLKHFSLKIIILELIKSLNF